MSKVPKWGGRRAQEWTRNVLARGGTVCTLRLSGCTGVATEGDHIVPRSVDITRQYDVTNGRPSCRHCNALRGKGAADAPSVVDARAFFENTARPRKDSFSSPPQASGKNEWTEPSTSDSPFSVRFESDAPSV
ncbi:HNH endonuclease signature motif containing protein [Nocardioides sp. LHD-245]|uniref:HNH endonuclease signature motif containing protein n=1 Tax=Nocardioides sp. LHD-245 TaxID=3051387 RepID=UPI003709C572